VIRRHAERAQNRRAVDGSKFFGYAGEGPTAIYFRSRRNGIVVHFGGEWGAPATHYKAWRCRYCSAVKASELAYGEIMKCGFPIVQDRVWRIVVR